MISFSLIPSLLQLVRGGGQQRVLGRVADLVGGGRMNPRAPRLVLAVISQS